MRPATSLIGRSSGSEPSSSSMVSYAIAAHLLRGELARELRLGGEVEVRVEDQAVAEEAVLGRRAAPSP